MRSYTVFLNMHKILHSLVAACATSPLVQKTLVHTQATCGIASTWLTITWCHLVKLEKLMQDMDHLPLLYCQELSLAEAQLLSRTQEYQMSLCLQKQLC